MKKHLMIILKCFAFFALFALGISLISMPIFDGFLAAGQGASWLRLKLELLPVTIVLFISFLFVWIIEKRSIKINCFSNPAKDLLLGITLGIVWIGAVVLLLLTLGTIRFEAIHPQQNWAVWILAVFINAVMQEYLVRGYLFQLLKKNYNLTTATIVTTILFTALHGGAFEAGAVAVLNVISMSLLMSFLLVYTQNLIAPILAHFIWNMVGCCLLNIVSLANDYPSLYSTAMHGNKLLTGGTAKIEGSIVTLLVNSLLIAVLLFGIQKQTKKSAQSRNSNAV